MGFVLDEGGPTPNDAYAVFYGERILMPVKTTCRGSPGHGSFYISDTAGDKIVSWCPLARVYFLLIPALAAECD